MNLNATSNKNSFIMKQSDTSRSLKGSAASIGSRSVTFVESEGAYDDMPEVKFPSFQSFEEHDRLEMEKKVSVLKEKERIYFTNAANVIRGDSRIELLRVASKRKPYLKEPRINKKCLEFLKAVELGLLEKVKTIYAQERSLNLETRRGDKSWTPLIMAVYFGHLDIVKLLINFGADVLAEDKDGFTPLMYATYNMNKNLNPHLIIRAISEAISHNKKKNTAICLI